MPKYNINDFDRLYRRTERRLGVSGQTVYIRLPPIGPRKIRVLSHITVENQTTDYTKCRLGVDHGGTLHYLDEITTVVADELCVARSDVQLGEGDQFFAELIGTTTGDVLILTCAGWDQEL